MKEYKLLITGTMGAGKTTAIRAISDIEPIVTDVVNHDKSVDKERTTVGLDYGMLTLDSGDRIRLFGTPGQARFDFLWKILARKALGLVILIDNSRPDPRADLLISLKVLPTASKRCHASLAWAGATPILLPRWTITPMCWKRAARSSPSSPSMCASVRTWSC